LYHRLQRLSTQLCLTNQPLKEMKHVLINGAIALSIGLLACSGQNSAKSEPKIEGKMDRLATYFDGDNYIQHNP
jgi:hypothetical protein